jgi:hypothetical protein
MRPSQAPPRPALRLLLLALMGLALASRLALGSIAPAEASPAATDALATLQAAMILCHGAEDRNTPPLPRHASPPPGDLLLADQADNAHALASAPPLPAARLPITTVIRLAWRSAGAFSVPRHRALGARGPPPPLT